MIEFENKLESHPSTSISKMGSKKGSKPGIIFLIFKIQAKYFFNFRVIIYK